MAPIGTFLLIIAVFYVQTDARLMPRISSFNKEQVFPNKRIIIGMLNGAVTENESFVYAICDSQEKIFTENRCNVSIETPVITYATYKETCTMTFKSDNPHHESLSTLFLHTFGDDKVMFSWLVKDSELRTKVSKVRIVRMSTCKYHEVAFMSSEAHNLIPYENTFDVIVKNKTFCGSESCRVTYDVDGKKVAGPTPFLSNLKFFYIDSVISAIPRAPIKGFYLEKYDKTGADRMIVHVGPDGKGTQLLDLKSPKLVKMSNAYDVFGVCYTTERTNITCKQYDAKMNLKFNVVLEFLDEPAGHDDEVRWLQPHNLQEGGMLVVTGASDSSGQSFEKFSVIKINPDGRKERPLVIDGLDFECRVYKFYASVTENDDNEVCFHFICELGKYGEQGLKSSMKFASKCLPKKYATLPKYRATVIN